MKRGPLLFLAVSLISALPSFAQNPEPGYPQECSDLLVAVDTARVDVVIHAEEHRVWRTAKPRALSTDFLTSVAAAVAAHLRLPTTVDSRTFEAWPGRNSDRKLTARAIYSSAVFTLQHDGRISGLARYSTGRSDGVELALIRAIIDADTARTLPRPAPAMNLQEVELQIGIDWRPRSENLLDSSASAPYHPGASRPVMVGSSTVERYRLDRQVRAKRVIRPPFPEMARQASVEDSVEIEFIVGLDGKVDMDRSRLVTATYAEFAREVAKILPEIRFDPAMSGGCPLRTAVRWPFVFRLEH